MKSVRNSYEIEKILRNSYEINKILRNSYEIDFYKFLILRNSYESPRNSYEIDISTKIFRLYSGNIYVYIG